MNVVYKEGVSLENVVRRPEEELCILKKGKRREVKQNSNGFYRHFYVNVQGKGRVK